MIFVSQPPILRSLAGAFVLALALSATAQPEIDIQKFTNGLDAPAAPGPLLIVGTPVQWTYVLTNTGSRPLTNISVVDDQGVTVTCPQTTLDEGFSFTCTASGSATPGQYVNIGTVTATNVLGNPVTASDTSHYLGNPLVLEKRTNGVDADTPPGISLNAGDAVSWTYEVTNTGTDPLTEVSVTDDQGVTVTCPQTTLAGGASMTCTANGIAVPGQYANVGTVVGTLPTATVSASDSSHYFGQALPLDFGDASDPAYPSLFANGGARHVLGGSVFLGSCVDAELDALPSAGANGDDLAPGTSFGTCATPGDDDDGVSFPAPLRIGYSGNVDVVASAPCTLSAWIDFEADGSWGEPGDALFPGGTALIAGTNSLTFTVPATAVAGSTVARFRCTTAGSVGITGQASDGEVEDHAVTIITAVATIAATKDDALLVDGDDDGLPDPGETLRYTVVIANSGNGDGLLVELDDTLDPNTTLIAGSVVTSLGSVTTGNAVGDTVVAVAVGTIPAGGSATITFDAVIDSLPPGPTTITNQGTVSGSNFGTVTTNPATTSVNAPAFVAIPTAGTWALFVLLAAIGTLATLRLSGRG